jgi:glycogen debranching enzyme
VAEVLLHAHVGFTEPREFPETFAAAVARVTAEFQQFLAPYRVAGVAAEFAETVANAVYLNWSCIVQAQGHFHRPSMLMSKNWMTNVWSWDHALNALALGRFHPELAWDQFMTIFDHQLPTGQLPDFVNDAVRLYSYVKPPIHGWVYGQLRQMHPWFDDRKRLAEAYEPLCRWTEWWFRFRCTGGDPLPLYYHGNDCGWDNATVFDAGVPARAPDLAAFLVLQLEQLAEIATRLGRTGEAAEWRARAEELLTALLARFWNGRKFVVLNAAGDAAVASDSVFGCLPVVLGKRLPASVRSALAVEVRRHLTAWGLATEHPESPLYKAAGYWRGPVWAPPTLIIVNGLRQIGERELADEITRRFCALCRQSGFAENFDALTGAPLCDPAYTWTAGTFLALAGSLPAGKTTPA